MKRIAIVGTGIAGMSCASELHGNYQLTVFEKNDYVGGHTNTVTVDEGGRSLPIDTGFMVYNEATYPNLTRLFSKLRVETKPTSMSFSVQHEPTGLEFSGTGFCGLFAQSKNILNREHWRFLIEISRFNKSCGEVLTSRDLGKMTVSEYCELRGYSNSFRDRYLVPMSAAVWSSPPGEMLQFPIQTLVRFFTNHRFLSLNDQLSWRTVVGGSKVYRDALVAPFAQSIQTGNPARAVETAGSGVVVTDSKGVRHNFDAAVIASHADEALELLASPTDLQRQLLSAWKYQRNIATLHSDESVMPKARRAWASWNYRVDRLGPSTVYWMNSLQGVSDKKNYFVSINDPGNLDRSKIFQEIEYHHPLYTNEAVGTQLLLPDLNEEGRLFFCGSYFRYGFHEDALSAGLSAATALKRRILP
jgi:predicted NAD/FAD-binding protein